MVFSIKKNMPSSQFQYSITAQGMSLTCASCLTLSAWFPCSRSVHEPDGLRDPPVWILPLPGPGGWDGERSYDDITDGHDGAAAAAGTSSQRRNGGAVHAPQNDGTPAKHDRTATADQRSSPTAAAAATAAAAGVRRAAAAMERWPSGSELGCFLVK